MFLHNMSKACGSSRSSSLHHGSSKHIGHILQKFGKNDSQIIDGTQGSATYLNLHKEETR